MSRKVRNWLVSANIMGLMGIGIGVASSVFAYKQARTGQDALDRATGKIAPKVEFADFHPRASDYPKSHLLPVLDTKEMGPHYPDANSLVLHPPILVMNNVGGESIEAVKVEATFLEGYIDSRDKRLDPNNPPTDWYKHDTPVLLRRAEREDQLLQTPWQPEMSLRVPVLRSVLKLFAQAQSKNRTDSLHYARISFMVSCRLTGSTVFHSDRTELFWPVRWMPKGFASDECKRVLEGYEPVQRLDQRAKVVARLLPGRSEDFNLFDDAVNLSKQK